MPSYRAYARLKRLIAPRLKYSQELYEDTLRRHLRREVRWLDLGCGHSVLPPWRAAEEVALVGTCDLAVGADHDLGALKKHSTIRLLVRAEATTLPFRDKSFDLVTANMVVEHLEQPREQLGEIARILTPGGAFVIHTPNAFGYATILSRALPETIKHKLIRLLDGRSPDDVFRTFYRANTERAIRRLSADTVLRVEDLALITTDAVFAVVPPLAAIELFWIRLLMTRALRPLRTNLIAVLRKGAPT